MLRKRRGQASQQALQSWHFLMRLNLYIQTRDIISGGVLYRARSWTWWTFCVPSSSGDLWFYSNPFWLSRDPLPAWWGRAHLSFPHRLNSMVKPARMLRMQRTKFCLCSGQHCHLSVLDSHSSPNYLKTCFCPFPFAFTTAMPPRGAVRGRTVLACTNSIVVITAWHTGLPTTWVMLQSHTFSFISCSHPRGHEIGAKTVVCLFSKQNRMDEQSILWETFAQENQTFFRTLQA